MNRQIKFRGKDGQGEWVYGSLVKISSGTYIIGEDGQFNDSPEYEPVGMGCGLEDKGITDRYEAMEHGWECAVEKCFEGSPAFTEIIPETIGQFTGLQDRDGEDIYEGDICIIPMFGNSLRWKVFFEGGCFQIFCIKNLATGFLSGWTVEEIIGNITDNPELLEGE